MRVHTYTLLVSVSLLAAGCMGGDDAGGENTNDPAPNADGGAGGDANATVEIANATLTLSPESSNVIPGSNATVSMPVNVTTNHGNLVVNTTIQSGTSVGLRFSGLGECEFEFPAPIQPGRTYTHECEAVPAGAYNLTYAHTSGSVTLHVVVLAGGGELTSGGRR